MSRQFRRQFASPGVIADGQRGIILDYGITVPVDGTAGYSPGCIFVDVDGTTGAVLYVNDGSLTSCDFNVINTSAGGSVANAVAGFASGYKLARGEVTLDGGNPTPIATGLASVVACTVTLKATSTPGDDPTSFSVDYGASGTVNLYAYKTDGSDPTLIASTNSAAVVSWIAVGT